MITKGIIDRMSIIHFIIYMIFGLLVKNKYEVALLIGIIWELFEYTITKWDYSRELLKQNWPIPEKYWNEKNIFNKLFDLVFNMFGYYIGNKI